MVRQFPFFFEPPSTKTLAALAVHFLNLDLQLYFSEDNTCLEGCCPYPKTYVGEWLKDWVTNWLGAKYCAKVRGDPCEVKQSAFFMTEWKQAKLLRQWTGAGSSQSCSRGGLAYADGAFTHVIRVLCNFKASYKLSEVPNTKDQLAEVSGHHWQSNYITLNTAGMSKLLTPSLQVSGGPTPPLVHFQATSGGYRGYPYIIIYSPDLLGMLKKYLYTSMHLMPIPYSFGSLWQPRSVFLTNPTLKSKPFDVIFQ